MTRTLRLSSNNIGDRKSARTRTVTESCPVRVSEHPVQRGEGPVNGGGNYDPLKVTTVALVKFGCMLEHLVSIPRYRWCISASRHYGDNAMGADNQQERLDPSWVSGFVDGEGCFYVGINRIEQMSLGWQVLPEFRVTQHERDEMLLEQIRRFFGFGGVRTNHGDRLEYRVRGLENLTELVEFFRRNPLHSKKRADFETFAEIIELMNDDRHLTKPGLDRIARLASTMNEGVTRSYLESSETVRRTPHSG